MDSKDDHGPGLSHSARWVGLLTFMGFVVGVLYGDDPPYLVPTVIGAAAGATLGLLTRGRF